MERLFLVLGALSAGAAVALGAFGAHTLRARLAPEMLDVFETGVRYQMYHTLAMLSLGAWRAGHRSRAWQLAVGLWCLGIVCFSGWLYANAVTGTTALPWLAPLGGTAFMAGWLSLAVLAFQTGADDGH